MSILSWRVIDSPKLSQSDMMLKAYDGHQFHPHRILTAFPIDLGGKNIFVKVEVMDAPSEYNLLLGHTWFYAMTIVALSIFRVLYSPHQGRIMTIDQLTFCILDLRSTMGTNISFVTDSQSTYTSVGVRMFKDSSLMGTFTLPSPSLMMDFSPIHMISSNTSGSFSLLDPWVVPNLVNIEYYRSYMPLSPTKITYQAIQSAYVDPVSNIQ
jgi:hypothetical protein